LSAYDGNRDDVVEGMIEADPIAAALRRLMTEQPEWTGTATNLLGVVNKIAADPIVRSKEWPKNPGALSGKLHRAAPFLRKIGIEIAFIREGKRRTRLIRITMAVPTPEIGGKQPSAPSASSAQAAKPNLVNGFPAPEQRTLATEADDETGRNGSTVRTNSLENSGKTDADAADANFRSGSASVNGANSRWTRRL
jgi:hypothetical protein